MRRLSIPINSIREEVLQINLRQILNKLCLITSLGNYLAKYFLPPKIISNLVVKFRQLKLITTICI